MMSVDEMDGFDDFESEVSSSEENTIIQRTHSQPQKKSIKSGKSSDHLSLKIIFGIIIGLLTTVTMAGCWPTLFFHAYRSRCSVGP